MNARTTTALIMNAVKAAEAAGIVVGAVEVQKGGVVRIIALAAVSGVLSPKQQGDSCDEVFG